MSEPSSGEGFRATVLLRRSRELVATREGRLIAVSAGAIYLFAALLAGKMLVFGPTGETSVSTVYLASGQPWWLFPMWIVLAPNAVLELPVFTVATMGLVSAGIGVGMGVAGVLALRLVRDRRRSLASPTAAGSLAGLTPAMIALLTLGACCSTTAAATAGIGVVASATGTSTDQLLANTWFLSIFQLAILWVALVAQERLIVVYSALLDPTRSGATVPATPRWDRAMYVRTGARLLLLAGAATWSLSMVADWTSVAPTSAPAAEWADWLLVVQVPAVAAGTIALAPGAFRRAARAVGARWTVPVARGVLTLAGVVLLIGVPPPWASAALHGWGNELLGAGFGAVPGAIAPGPTGIVLLLRWLLQMIPLGATALALGLFPSRVLRMFGAGPARAEDPIAPDPARHPEPHDTWAAPPVASDRS